MIINRLTFAYELTVIDDKMNAYKNKEFNLLKELDNKWIEFIFSNSIPLQIGYNPGTSKNYLYVCFSISSNLTEEMIKLLEHECNTIIKTLDLKTLFPTITNELSVVEDFKTIPFLESDKLKGYVLLRYIMSSPAMIETYNKFSSNKLVIEHLKFISAVKSFGIKKNKEYEFKDLPIHELDLGTNTLLVREEVLRVFDIFKLFNAFVSLSSVDDIQYEIGKLMMLDLTFGDFVVKNAKSLPRPATQEEANSEEFKKNLNDKSQELIKLSVKKAKSLIKKNKIPDLYLDLLTLELA